MGLNYPGIAFWIEGNKYPLGFLIGTLFLNQRASYLPLASKLLHIGQELSVLKKGEKLS